jgi:FkbM family methyltransferase
VFSVAREIIELIVKAQNQKDFLETLFGEYKQSILDGAPLILFGAGALGKDMLIALADNNIKPICFCDNEDSKWGSMINGIPVISPQELYKNYSDAYVVLTVLDASKIVMQQLLRENFESNKIFRKDNDLDSDIIVMYVMSKAMLGTQPKFVNQKYLDGQTDLDKIIELEAIVEKAYECFDDSKSKELFITKLALLGSEIHFSLFKRFMLLFSEAIHRFGILNYKGTPEDYLYFHSDTFQVQPNEVYIDVGAYDGDTIETFVQACNEISVKYQHIYALEPDQECFDRLVVNTKSYDSISLFKLGMWSESTSISFVESHESAHDQAAQISKDSETGASIDVVSLDDFCLDKAPTLIKMDPPGNIINEIIKGGSQTIKKYKPKLALGSYHSLDEFVEVPIMLKQLCPDYKLVLRHNTYHLCDTDLYAYV